MPPGQGKPSTHSRNRRRKKKREYQKLIKTGLLEALPEVSTIQKRLSEANNVPLGPSRIPGIIEPVSEPLPTSALARSSESTASQRAVALSNNSAVTSIPIQDQREAQDATSTSNAEYVYVTPDQVMMGSLRNKNKKKGFKQSMAGPIPRKIVFSHDDPNKLVSSTSKPDTQEVNATDLQLSLVSKLNLISPSELQEQGKLPPNMFVTCVDVKAGDLDFGDLSSRKKGKKRKKKAQGNEYDWDLAWEDGYGEERYDNDGMSYSDTVTRYDGTPSKPSSADVVDWPKAEKCWETSFVVENPEQIKIGATVGWKVSNLVVLSVKRSTDFLLNRHWLLIQRHLRQKCFSSSQRFLEWKAKMPIKRLSSVPYTGPKQAKLRLRLVSTVKLMGMNGTWQMSLGLTFLAQSGKSCSFDTIMHYIICDFSVGMNVPLSCETHDGLIRYTMGKDTWPFGIKLPFLLSVRLQVTRAPHIYQSGWLLDAAHLKCYPIFCTAQLVLQQ